MRTDSMPVKRRCFLQSGTTLFFVFASCARKRADVGEEISLASQPLKKRDFAGDGRSNKVVFVAHCILNQNAREENCADFPAMMEPLLEFLKNEKIGIIQMPCPEMTCLGLPRTRAEDQSILDVLDTPEGRVCCAQLAASVADTIEEYQRHGYTVVALLGGDVGSPGCAVPPPEARAGDTDEAGAGYGVFIRALLSELRGRGIRIPLRGIRDSSRETLNEDLDWLNRVLGRGASAPH